MCNYSQLLGFEVDAINSVQFSNHTGIVTVTTAHPLDFDYLSVYIAVDSGEKYV